MTYPDVRDQRQQRTEERYPAEQQAGDGPDEGPGERRDRRLLEAAGVRDDPPAEVDAARPHEETDDEHRQRVDYCHIFRDGGRSRKTRACGCNGSRPRDPGRGPSDELPVRRPVPSLGRLGPSASHVRWRDDPRRRSARASGHVPTRPSGVVPDGRTTASIPRRPDRGPGVAVLGGRPGREQPSQGRRHFPRVPHTAMW